MSLTMGHHHDVHRRSVRPAAVTRSRALVATGAIAAGVLIATLIADRALWTYSATIVLLSFAAVLVINRDLAPTKVQSTQLVIAGERRTANVLEPLPNAGWTIMKGVRGHRLTVEQLVITPSGPFAIITKTVSGTVRVSRGLVTITPPGAAVPDFPSDAWGYEARTIAAESYQLLKERTGTATSVRAIVVVWGAFPQRCVSGHNVTFIHGDDLAAWLRTQASQAA